MNEKTRQFLQKFQESLERGDFIKLTLSQYKGGDKTLKNIYARKVLIKREEHLSFIYRHKTNDITKNFSLAEGMSLIERALSNDFDGATLFTTEMDLTLDKGKLKTAKPSQKKPEHEGHDRIKNRLIEAGNAPYLHALKITDENGKVYKTAQDKFRQINKYVEIMSPLVKEMGAGQLKKIVDIGSGKGYLTFALYDYLHKLGFDTQIIGVEYREDMVRLCNSIAGHSGFNALKFVQASAQDYNCSGADAIIALHACDTATDDALAKGVEAGAGIIVVAPCCHKQIRREMESAKEWDGLDFMLSHGIYRERMGEMITDGLRGLMLEYHGYTVKIFEFISSEHTAKNIMIVATKTESAAKRPEKLDEIISIKKRFGITQHYLERFLLPASAS
jgi:precorrin-6B methylase 2